MSVLVTKHPDNFFSVIVSDSKDRPANLIAGVKQCPKRSIKALFIAPSFHTAGWEQALTAIAPLLRPGLAVSHYEVSMGDTIIALPASPAGPVPMPYPNLARSDTKARLQLLTLSRFPVPSLRNSGRFMLAVEARA
jgi:hypothetical protein